MFDLKAIEVTLSQLEEERGISREVIIDAIEHALAAAYKKDYGKKGQIVRAKFDLQSGATEFYQVKIVVDPSMLRPETDEAQTEEGTSEPEDDGLIRFNEEHHIMLEDALMIKKDVKPGDEIVFPLETKQDYGRVAAQTAKQVIIQRIREAEKDTVLREYGERQGEVMSGTVQRIERGNVFVDLGRAVAIMPREEQIPGERFKQGERIRAYLYIVEEGQRGVSLKLSRSHPKFVEKLFEMEVPEISSGVVKIRNIAREAGSRTKIAVYSEDELIDPVGSCVGQRGVRVSTVMSELGGEKIDIIEWSDDPVQFIEDALSPAQIRDVRINEEEHEARITVDPDQLSLAIGKGGQNVRLAAKLTGWKLDIAEDDAKNEESTAEPEAVPEELPEELEEELERETEEELHETEPTAAEDEIDEVAEDEEPDNLPEVIEEQIAEEQELAEENEENTESSVEESGNDADETKLTQGQTA